MVLLLALLVVVLLIGVLALAVAFAQERQQAVQRETAQIHLVALSDAALAETLAHLARSRGAGGVPRRDFDGGQMESQVETTGPSTRLIRVRSEYRGREREVEAAVRLTARGPIVTGWRVVSAHSGTGSKQ